MLSLQTITTVSPIRSDEELAQAHRRLDELIATQAYNSPAQEVQDEFEVLTALIFYYEQRTRRFGEFGPAASAAEPHS